MNVQKRGNAERLIIVLALLAAIGIILGKFLAFNITEFMRFSLENLTIFIASIAFGPLAGLIVAVCEDIIGCMLAGYVWNPLITLGAALNGAVAGLIYKYLVRVPSAPRMAISVIVAHLVGSVLTKTLGLSIFYSLPFLVTLGWRSLNYVIVGAIEVAILFYLFKSKLLLSNIDKIKRNINKTKGYESDEL